MSFGAKSVTASGALGLCRGVTLFFSFFTPPQGTTKPPFFKPLTKRGLPLSVVAMQITYCTCFG